MPGLPQTTEERLAIAEEKITALAGMNNHLEERLDAVEMELARLQAYLPQDKQQEAVKGEKMTDEQAVQCILGAVSAAASNDKPDGLIIH